MSRFVFMLTRDDATVPDAVAVCRGLEGLNVDVVGFKDVGLPHRELAEVVAVLRDQGREVALEVVSEHRDDELRAIDVGLALGVDLLLGGVSVADGLRHISGADQQVRYCPFPGEVVGHPSRLEGTIDSILASACELAETPGVWGLDVLAYRFAGDADSLVRRVVDSVDVPVIVAGSVADVDRIGVIATAGAWGFTVGGAVFDRRFVPGGSLADQLAAIAAVSSSPAAAARPPRPIVSRPEKGN